MIDTQNTDKVAPNPERKTSTKAVRLMQVAVCRVCGAVGIPPLEQDEPTYCLAHLPEGRMMVCIDTETGKTLAAYLSLDEDGKAFINGALASLIERAGKSSRPEAGL